MRKAEQCVRLFIAEEQELLQEAYQLLLSGSEGIDIVGAEPHVDARTLVAAAALSPDVMIIGTRSLTESTINNLRVLRRSAPNTGLVLLSFAYDARTMTALREFSRHTMAGCAYLTKHTVGTVHQLAQMVLAVAEGRIIIDPGVLDGFVTPRMELLRHLSPRELEVLGWMARGYRNNAIAQILHLVPRTVERHVHNIYAKLSECPDSKDPRVHAVALFLTATGCGPHGWLEEDDDWDYLPNRATASSTPDSASRSAQTS